MIMNIKQRISIKIGVISMIRLETYFILHKYILQSGRQMGCASSEAAFEPQRYDNKTVVWFLGGGPGAPKQQVAQYLTEQYKFKYLSLLELVRFEEKVRSQEATEIRKAIQQKVDFSSSLLVRILKKVLVLYGPRKYLIDNFPRNMSDVLEFQNFSKKYPQIVFQGMLQIDLTEAQMKQNGMITLSELKKQASAEDIEKEVRKIIETYREKVKDIMQYYQQRQFVHRVDFINQDVQLTSNKVEQTFAKKSIKPVTLVPFNFLNGNNQEELYRFGLNIARQFGMKFWSIRQIFQDYKGKPQIDKLFTEKSFDPSSELAADLMYKKLEKYNYKGKYLIIGFPRNESDITALKVKFRGQMNFLSYTGCLHTPTTQNEKYSFQSLHKYLTATQQLPSTLINSSDRSLQDIVNHIRKFIPKRRQNQLKVTLFPCLQQQGAQYFKKGDDFGAIVHFDELLKIQSKKDSLVSDMISSCLDLNTSIPNSLALNLVFQKIQQLSKNIGKNIIFKGFPQNLEQLKLFLSRSQIIGALSVVSVDSSRIKKNIKDLKQANLIEYEKLATNLKYCCSKAFKITQKTTSQQIKTFFTN